MATLKNLNDREYFLRETNTNNSYLNIHGLDTVVGSGFYSFYIVGSRHLEKGSEIRFEIVDSAGNPVEIAGVRSIRKGNARIISFSVPNEVANGGATLYVQATLNNYLDENNFPTSVPSEWAGKSNLLFSYNFTIDKDKTNSDDIIFRKQPKVDVTPTVKEVDRVGKNSITVATGSGGAPLTGSVIDFEQISESDYLVTFEADNDSFIGDMRHGDIRFINRKYLDDSGNVKTFSYVSNSLNPVDDGYEGSINKIRSKKSVEVIFVNPDLDVFGPGGNISYESTFIPKGQDYTFEVDYVTDVFTEESLIQQGTYADIRLRDLQTVSGDVELVKIYTKSDSEGTNYSLIFEGEIDEQESLLEIIDNFDIGLFNSSSKLTQWTASDATNPNNTPADTTPEFLLSDDLLLNGAVISGSNDVFTKDVNGKTLQTPLYSLESNTSFTLYRDIDYTIALNAAVENVTTDDTRLDVYISGSNLPKGCSNKFGTLIHSFRTDSDKKWFSDDIQITYNRENTIRDARIIFVVTSGKWHLSDIELNPNILKGFTPGEYRAQVPLNVLRPNQDFDFKIEFYDGAGAKANTIVYEDNVTFERSNIVIEGHKNLVTGSLFVGDNTGSGVQFGSSGTGGNFASVGYEGFTSASQKIAPAGFLMWSGSVLPNSGDNYQGVGLELVIDSGSYFRYRTNPEELTVRTDNFFFGSEDQYISGSNGNIEISSSVFFLDPSTDTLIISGTIEAQVANIGGFVVSDDALTATSSGFYLSGSAAGNEFFISSSEFNVKASGDVTGSSVLFDGGRIGGWTITDTYLSSSNLIINSNGTLSTADFADGVRGWTISSLGNGSAQFENVKIRGTLRTTVFEKETVNAIGGQLWVANSTILSQSVSATDTTMSVENVTGFEVGEILLAKKIDNAGFNSEYILIESSSRTNPASDIDLSGNLYVVRGYGEGLSTGSDVTWVSELAQTSSSYTEGQVIASTGRENTGWILLNATPTDTGYTPYIDIVERTGSGVYDYDLKARLGDLSGLSQTRLLGVDPNDAGFGLYSENVFLEGGIRASFGEIGGFSIDATSISSSNDNLILRSNGQITASNALIQGVINVVGGNAATQTYASTQASASASQAYSSASSDISDVSSSASTARDNVSGSLSTSIANTSSSLSNRIVTDAANKIVKPNLAPTGQGSGLFLAQSHLGFYDDDAINDWTAYISSSGEFLFQQDANNQLSFGNGQFSLKTEDAVLSGSQVNIITPTFFFGDSSNQYISGSNGNLEISSSQFHLQNNGNALFAGELQAASGNFAGTLTGVTGDFSGTITSSAGKIGGWNIGDDTLSGGSVTLNSSGSIAAGSTTFGSSGVQIDDNSGGRIYAGDGSNQFMQFDGTRFTFSASNAELDSSGNFSATNAEIEGNITASNLRIDNDFSLGVSMSIDAGGRIQWLNNSGSISDDGITFKEIQIGQSLETAQYIKWEDGTGTNTHIIYGNNSRFAIESAREINFGGIASASSMIIDHADEQVRFSDDVLVFNKLDVDALDSSRLIIPVGTDKYAT